MRRKPLCVLLAGVCGLLSVPRLAAQPVPARDLWEFPLGAVLEPPAVAQEAGTGMWNPASIAMSARARLRLGVASLSASANQGVDAQLVGAALRLRSGSTLGLSVARAGVNGVVRTDSDPQGFGSVQYASWLISATVARRVLPHVTFGAAARYREGQTDQARGSAIAGDLGVIVDSLPWHRARLAVSSFLWRPGRERDDRPALLMAADMRLLARATAPDIRVGYLRNVVTGNATEHGPFMSVQTGALEVRGTLVVTHVYEHANYRARSGVALHYARYVVGIAREEGTGGLGPLYQFTLSSTVK